MLIISNFGAFVYIILLLDLPSQLGYSVAMAEKKIVKKNLYPELIIPNNEHPNRLLAFPILGYLIKIILLIPVAFVSFGYVLAVYFLLIATPFVILFTGKYWDAAYNFLVGWIKFSIKISLYMAGLTDKYPGFGLDDSGIFTLNIKKPSSPSRLLAFPALGFWIRVLLLVPYVIFDYVLIYGTYPAVIFSWFAVLFTGKYPESLYGFIRDSIRVDASQKMYILYLSDTYPSFYISMKHKIVKILLIILGILYLIANINSNVSSFNKAASRNRDLYKSNHYNYGDK